VRPRSLLAHSGRLLALTRRPPSPLGCPTLDPKSGPTNPCPSNCSRRGRAQSERQCRHLSGPSAAEPEGPLVGQPVYTPHGQHPPEHRLAHKPSLPRPSVLSLLAGRRQLLLSRCHVEDACGHEDGWAGDRARPCRAATNIHRTPQTMRQSRQTHTPGHPETAARRAMRGRCDTGACDVCDKHTDLAC
jgi:hypothetical protein